MNLLQGFMGIYLVTWLLLLWPAFLGAQVTQLVAEAKREGTLDFYGPDQVKATGTMQLESAFNKKYGLNIRLKYTESTQMMRDVGKLVTEVVTGGSPDWDVMVLPDTHHAVLWFRKLLLPLNFKGLGIEPKMVQFDSSAVSFANQFALPAYNKAILAPSNVPKSWTDLLDAKWKGGKLGLPVATPAHLALLAVGPWGEERTAKYVKALSQQGLTIGRLGEIYNRMLIGETLATVTLTNSFIFTAQKTRAPIVFAEEVEPVISPAYYAAVLKGSRHPAVGQLFVAFLTTLEAQKLWEKFVGHTSAFIPGTPAYQFAQGKNVIYMTQDQANTVDRITKDFAKMLGI